MSLKVGQKVRVTVVEVDLPRKRIALSMKQNPEAPTGGSSRGDAPRTPIVPHGGQPKAHLHALADKSIGYCCAE